MTDHSIHAAVVACAVMTLINLVYTVCVARLYARILQRRLVLEDSIAEMGKLRMVALQGIGGQGVPPL